MSATTEAMRTVIYPVRDLEAAKALFRALLGVDPSMDEPYYAAFAVAGQHFGLDPNGHGKGMTGPVCFWDVDDIEGRLKALTDAGGETLQGVRDVGGGKLTAMVKDADGNIIGLAQAPAA
ncbi:glyoxalase [Streptomyces sp. ISL-10]|uniref:VOC family protein n=1 Tax=Streptomyces sp. ISL-10 TaxID=2819172 RepID=UPI001BE5DFA6|nr:VOC family protein [Streptomyces sp. ISL-10]MBT2369421.1 glyoxalase [Streptomyces sp. ISL-10]